MAAYKFSWSLAVTEIMSVAAWGVKRDFAGLLEVLAVNPFPRAGSPLILRSQDMGAGADSFTAEFDHAFLTYDVSRMEVVKLVDIEFRAPFVLPPPEEKPASQA